MLTALAGDSDPLAVAKFTVIPLIAFPSESTTFATSGLASAVPSMPLCALPLTSITVLAGASVAVAVNLSVPATLAASRVSTRGTEPMRQPPLVATPLPLLTDESFVGRPVPGGRFAQYTVTPGTGLPSESRTVRAGATGSTAPTAPVCALPACTTIDLGTPVMPVATKTTAGSVPTFASNSCAPEIGPSVPVTLAKPLVSVITVALETWPPLSERKVTGTPFTPLESAAFTWTMSGSGSAVPTVVACESPRNFRMTTGTGTKKRRVESLMPVAVEPTIHANPRRCGALTEFGCVVTRTFTDVSLELITSGMFAIAPPALSVPVERYVRLSPNSMEVSRGLMMIDAALAPVPTYLTTTVAAVGGIGEPASRAVTVVVPAKRTVEPDRP